MTVSVATLRTNFPEFAEAPGDAVVQRCLDTAAKFVSGFPDSETQDLAQQYYAAHLITRDPRGEPVAKRPYGGGANIIQQASVQRGDRFSRGTDDYLQSYLDLRAAYIVPLLVS